MRPSSRPCTSIPPLVMMFIAFSCASPLERQPAHHAQEDVLLITDLDDTLIQAHVASPVALVGRRVTNLAGDFSGCTDFLGQMDKMGSVHVLSGGPAEMSGAHMKEFGFPNIPKENIHGRDLSLILGDAYKNKVSMLLGNRIPAGEPVIREHFEHYLDNLGGPSFTEEWQKQHPQGFWIMVGDNTEADPLVYGTLQRAYGIKNRSAIFTRVVDDEQIHSGQKLTILSDDLRSLIDFTRDPKTPLAYYEMSIPFFHVLEIPLYLLVQYPNQVDAKKQAKLLQELTRQFVHDLRKDEASARKILPAYQITPYVNEQPGLVASSLAKLKNHPGATPSVVKFITAYDLVLRELSVKGANSYNAFVQTKDPTRSLLLDRLIQFSEKL